MLKTQVVVEQKTNGITNQHYPQRKVKRKSLTKQDKKKNQALASERAANDNVIGMIK